ncbi:hypothetical protein BGZ73_006113 [Actinomortierella ambigua]|nr:hypothetical protein BGZ73_006113 [Actinomortierella ambigua]
MASAQGSYATGQYQASGAALGAPLTPSTMQQRSSDSTAAPISRQPASSQHLNPQDQQNAARTRSGSNSKQLLTMALVEAQNAVQLDNASDILGALESYKRAVALLARVMETSPSEDEQERLKTIHDSYLFRIRLLSTPAPGPSSVSTAAAHTRATDDQGSHHSSAPLDKASVTPTTSATSATPAAASSTIAGVAVGQEHLREHPVSSSSSSAEHQHQIQNQHHFHEESEGPSLATRRAKKPAPAPILPTIPPPPPATTALPALPPNSDARTTRQRSGSTASADVRPPRNHNRTHTGGSTRGPGDILMAAEQLQMHAQQRLPSGSSSEQMRRVKSREHLIPFHSAPTAPLPPPPSTPPPLPQLPSGTTSPVKSPSSPINSNPTTPSLAMPAMFSSIPISPPPRSPLPQVPSATPSSPPPVPANPTTRRVSPLASHPAQPPPPPRVSPPSQPSSAPAHPPPQPTSNLTKAMEAAPSKTSASPDNAPGEEPAQQSTKDQFYDELENVADEWLPNLSEKDFDVDKSMMEQLSLEPLPRERVTSRSSLSSVISDLQIPARTNSRNMGNHASKEDLRQQLRSSAGSGGNVQRSRSPVMHHASQQPQQQQQSQQQQNFSQHYHQHQRSQSQSSLLQSSQPVSSRTSPMYTLQGGTASISSLPSLDPSTGTFNHKRISDSARSFKESPLGQSLPIGPGSGPSSPVLRSSPARFDTTAVPSSMQQQQQQSSHLASSNNANANASGPNSKLTSPYAGSGGLSSATSPTMSTGIEKERSPSLGGGGSGAPGGQTIFDVLAEDPFAGMSFPLPPPYIEPPPVDPHLRCFWLMRKLEQSMTTGGFVTRRMYVPRSVWFQSQVRIPAADPKIAACQGFTTGLNKMWQQSQRGSLNLMVEAGGGAEGDQERAQVLKELDALEQIANQMQSKLAKKLSFIQRPGKNSSLNSSGGGLGLTISTAGHHQMYSNGEITAGPATGGGNRMTMMLADSQIFELLGNEEPMPGNQQQQQQQQQSPPAGGTAQFSPPPQTPTTAAFSSGDKKKSTMSIAGSSDNSGLKGQWKSFSKSVQKSIVNDKLDDTYAYTDAVIHLFQASYFLESLLRHYNSLGPYQTHIQIVNRLRRLCDFLGIVVCAFVIRDMGELMGKYVKRVGAWVAD